MVPGQYGYESLTRYLPTEELTANKLAANFVETFGKVSSQLSPIAKARLWGRTVKLLQNH
jgi:hypothetical protein